MKSLFFAALCLFSIPSFAKTNDEIRILPVETEMNARKHSCLSAESTVRRRGAVIMHYGEGLFERVVAHAGFCERGESTVPFYAPTLDSEACFLGYRCAPIDPDMRAGGEE